MNTKWISKLIAFIVVCALLLIGTSCELSSVSETDSTNSADMQLDDEAVFSNAIKVFEDINYLLIMDRYFDIEYTDFKYETDGYNRYIVALYYDYKDEKNYNHKDEFVVFFSYDPEENVVRWSKNNYVSPIGKGVSGAMDYAKEIEEFGWGTEPAE